MSFSRLVWCIMVHFLQWLQPSKVIRSIFINWCRKMMILSEKESSSPKCWRLLFLGNKTWKVDKPLPHTINKNTFVFSFLGCFGKLLEIFNFLYIMYIFIFYLFLLGMIKNWEKLNFSIYLFIYFNSLHSPISLPFHWQLSVWSLYLWVISVWFYIFLFFFF